jgi:PAS domain S-box-containing protein
LEKKAQTKSPRTLQKANILLVDDQPNNLVALEAVLTGPHYNLISAHSGSEAIELVQKYDFAVILMDVQMPQMDGFETVKRMKSIAGCKDTPIIFITAIYTEDPFVKKGYEVGAIDYFSKPFDPDILRLKVDFYSSFYHKAFLLREREKRLEETEELLSIGRKLTGCLENLPVGVLIADSKGRICQANKEMAKIWGLEESIEHDAYGKLLGWWSVEGELKASLLSDVLKSGKTAANKPIEIKCADNTHKKVIMTVSPLWATGHKLTGAVAVIQDITQHEKIQSDIETRVLKLVSAGLELEHCAH